MTHHRPPTASVENVSRRGALKGLLAAGGLILSARLTPGAQAAFPTKYGTGAGDMPHGTVNDPKVFVSIAADGTVTIVAHRQEMGTGIRTSLPMVVADEMGADWGRVKVIQADGDEVRYGNQDTDGSRSTRHYLVPMRQVGAAARTMLETAAAAKWNVPVGECKAGVHEVVHEASNRKLGFGALAEDAAKLPVPQTPSLVLKDPAQFRYIGKGQVGIVDLRDITVGKATYGADVRLPGMKYVGDRTSAGDGRQAGVVRRQGCAGRARRRAGAGGARLSVAVEVPAARRRRGDRAQHRHGDQGAGRAQAGLG